MSLTALPGLPKTVAIAGQFCYILDYDMFLY